jgi:biotin-dependent carboxylase-like uncharacterized protein
VTPASRRNGPVLEVVDPGLLLSVQDGGRQGLASEGVTRGGAADAWSLGVANALLGNSLDAAALEATLLGPTVRALATGTVALAGTMSGRVTQTGERIRPGSSVTLSAGQELSLEPALDGVRGYLAVPGGLDVPVVLGSRSTALRGGFGGVEGRPLRPGDRVVAAGAAGAADAGRDALVLPRAHWPGDACPAPVTAAAPLRVLPGPHAGDLGADALPALVGRAWTVAHASDRVGLRLDGEPLPAGADGELPSHGVLAGVIQVPPDGFPIVLQVDHQPTGGYPLVAVVITADLPRLGQLGPGAAVWFELVAPGAAREALARMDAELAGALAHLREAARWDDLWRGAGA